jgi:uncharacterized protein (DUF1778 family)
MGKARVLKDQETMTLSARDRAVFVRALLSPLTLRGPLAKAVRRYRRSCAGS